MIKFNFKTYLFFLNKKIGNSNLYFLYEELLIKKYKSSIF